MSNQDPFYAVKDKIVFSLSTLRGLNANFQSSISKQNADFIDANQEKEQLNKSLNEIKQKAKEISLDLNDLNGTVEIVSSKRARFASISDSELEARKKFIHDTRQQLKQLDGEEAEKAMNNQIQRRQRQQAKRKENETTNNNTVSSTTSSSSGSSASVRKEVFAGASSTSHSRFADQIDKNTDRESEEYLASAQQTQMSIESKQNEVLDDMHSALVRLQGLGGEIKDELREHEVLINDLDNNIDLANDRMSVVIKKVENLLRKSSSGKLICIAILAVISIILLLLIVYG